MATLRLVPVSGPAIDDVKDQTVVGRDPSCEIVVTDGSVSRRHARLERRAGAWWVVDQGSANGTYVNSLKIAEQALKNNQELRFGAMAFRVDLHEDPEATVATPFLSDDSATVMAPATPPPIPHPAPLPPLPSTPTPRPVAPPPIPHAAAPPPAPPSAAAAKERFRAAGPAAPVPQMPGGAPPAKKGKSPLFWVAIGCCGCLLLVAALAGVIGGGVFMATRGAADAAHAWLGQVRQGQTDEVAAGMTEAYRSRPTAEEVEAVTTAIGQSKDATFLSRSVDNDRATMTGVLTGGPSPQPIVIKLVKEGGAWKVDDVTIGVQ
ncbi:MAG TPA: FHA domain-containing protein [Vicinamibacteria bacterium]|nr:FHA domain-containing protein [Vicinamibacteria bacterium]